MPLREAPARKARVALATVKMPYLFVHTERSSWNMSPTSRNVCRLDIRNSFPRKSRCDQSPLLSLMAINVVDAKSFWFWRA
jgi:hypothetical protein